MRPWLPWLLTALVGVLLGAGAFTADYARQGEIAARAAAVAAPGR